MKEEFFTEDELHRAAKRNRDLWFQARLLNKEKREMNKTEHDLLDLAELTLDSGVMGTFRILMMKKIKGKTKLALVEHLETGKKLQTLYLEPQNIRTDIIFQGRLYPMFLAQTPRYYFSPFSITIISTFSQYIKLIRNLFTRDYELYIRMKEATGACFPCFSSRKEAEIFLQASSIPGKEKYKEILKELPKTFNRNVTLVARDPEPYILTDFDDLLAMLREEKGKLKKESYIKPFLAKGYLDESLLYFLLFFYLPKIIDIFHAKYKTITTPEKLFKYLVDKGRVRMFNFHTAMNALYNIRKKGKKNPFL